MGKTSFNRLNHKIKSWRIGDYFRQFSIVAAGIIVTFWGNDRITENARQKEVRATMQLVTEELEYNRQELRNIKHLLDIDIHMSLLLREHDMDVSKIPTDTALMSAAMSREWANVFDGGDGLRDQALFLVQYKKFINYVNMVPGFLYWHEFDKLDEMLDKQIQALKAKYK